MQTSSTTLLSILLRRQITLQAAGLGTASCAAACGAHKQPPLAAARGCTFQTTFPPLPKRARCEAPADGPLHELAAASAAAAAQEDSPLPDEWMPDVAAGNASAERRWDSEASHLLKRGVEAYHYQLDCEEGGVYLLEDADMP